MFPISSLTHLFLVARGEDLKGDFLRLGGDRLAGDLGGERLAGDLGGERLAGDLLFLIPGLTRRPTTRLGETWRSNVNCTVTGCPSICPEVRSLSEPESPNNRLK